MKIRKSKYLILLFALIAVFSWHFININVTPSQPLTLSYSAPVAFAQATSTSPGYVGFLTSMLNGNNNTAWFNDFYNFSRGLLNIILLAFLVYVAFRNILNAGIENYGVKKILPKLIFAAFLGNLIRPVMAVASRIVDTLISGNITILKTPASWSWVGTVIASAGHSIISLAHSGGGIMSLLTGGIAVVIMAVSGTWFLLIIAIVLMMLAVIIGMLVINLFHTIAPWVVLFATAVGPIAIGLSILPETESLYKKWLKIIVFWLFFPVIINAVYYLITKIPPIPPASGGGAVSDIISAILPMIIKIGLFVLAIRIPFTWEKDVGGVIAALPGSVASGSAKFAGAANKAARQVGGGIVLWGRGKDQELEGIGQRAGEKYHSTAVGLASTKYSTDTSDENLRTKKQFLGSSLTSKLSENPEDAQNIFGSKNFTLQDMLTGLDKFNAGAFAPGGPEADTKKQKFFTDNLATSEAKAKESYVAAQAADLEQDRGQEVIDQTKKKPTWVLADWAQTYTASGIGNALSARGEIREKELVKASFRKDKLGKLVAGEWANGKRQFERVNDDAQNSQSEEELEQLVGRRRNKIIEIKRQKMSQNGYVATTLEAAAAVQAEAEKLHTAAESQGVYNSAFLGMRALADGFDDKGNKIVSKGDRIDDNDLAGLQAGHLKERQLAASASRSTRSLADQRFIRDQKITNFYAGAASPSAAIHAQQLTANSARERTQNLQILNALKMINQTLVRTNGTAAIRQLNSTFKNTDFSSVTEDDYNAFSSEKEGDLLNLERTLTDKSNPQTANNFVQELKISRGLDTPAMLQKAEQQFGNDPEVQRMVIDYGRKQQLGLTILSKSEQLQTLRTTAGQLAMKESTDPQVALRVTDAVKTYLNGLTPNSGIPPKQSYAAKSYLAAQAGFSDPSQLTANMVRTFAMANNLTTIRNPEVE